VVEPPSPRGIRGREFSDGETLGAARRWLREQARGDGASCPCCSQFVKVYRRSLNAGIAVALIRAWRQCGRAPWHLPTLFGASGDIAKARYWQLIEPASDELREDGSPRNGWWQLTDAGAQWVQGETGVWRYAFVFDGNLLQFDRRDPAGPTWRVQQALGRKFNFAQLMSDPAPADGAVFT